MDVNKFERGKKSIRDVARVRYCSFSIINLMSQRYFYLIFFFYFEIRIQYTRVLCTAREEGKRNNTYARVCVCTRLWGRMGATAVAYESRRSGSKL